MKKPVKERRPRTAPPARAERDTSAADQARGIECAGDQPRRHDPHAVEAHVVEAHVTVVNKRGLHARAAAKFVKLAGEFVADIQVSAAKGGLAGGAIVSGRSIMGLMMLAAAPGCVLHIAATGTDAAAALAALVGLVEGGFEEKD